MIMQSIAVVTTMPTVTSVHEEMHNETTQEKRKRQIGSEVLAVINDEVHTGCRKQDAKYPTNGRVFHTEGLIGSFEAGIMHPDHIGTSDHGYQG